MIDNISNFQKEIYQRLAGNKFLNEIVTGVFTKVPQDTKFPYIVLEVANVKDHSTKTNEIIKFELNISAYVRKLGQQQLFSIGSLIEDTLEDMNSTSCKIAFKNSNILQKTDGITQELIMQYSVVLK